MDNTNPNETQHEKNVAKKNVAKKKAAVKKAAVKKAAVKAPKIVAPSATKDFSKLKEGDSFTHNKKSFKIHTSEDTPVYMLHHGEAADGSTEVLRVRKD